MNALAAYAVGSRSGVDPLDAVGALESMRPTEKRGNLLEWGGAEIVNDTYNSNPKALEGMVEALKRTEAKRRIVVAGEMLELGPEGVGCMRLAGRRWWAGMWWGGCVGGRGRWWGVRCGWGCAGSLWRRRNWRGSGCGRICGREMWCY